MLVHYVFLEIGLKKLKDRKDWLENMKVNKQLNPHITFKLWDDKKVNELINKHYPQYKGIIKKFPHKFYLIDFCRYLIMDKYGGMYMDLDLRLKKTLPKDLKVAIGSSYTSKGEAINNNVIYFKDKVLNKNLLDYCVSEIKRIEDKGLFKKWSGRHFLNSVSAYMFKRFIKKNKLKSDIDFREYFYDGEAGSWIEAGIIKKHHLKRTGEGTDY